MTFVVTDDNRDRLNDFTQLLLSTFHGSVLYLYLNPVEVINHLRDHQADAIFIEAFMKEMDGVQLIFELRKKKHELPTFILADSDKYKDIAMQNNADGYLIRPVSEDELQNVVQSAIEKKCINS